MRRAMALLACGVLTGVAGCGGGAGEARVASPSYAGGPPSDMDAKSAAASPPDAPPEASALSEAAPAPPPGQGQWSAPEPTPQDRPGLGTEWGETRESRIHEVTFFRSQPDSPFAVAELHYNDWQGVQSLASFHGGGRLREIPAANGAITVSIRDGSGDALEAVRAGDRTYIVAQEGERYSIVIENHSQRRFEAVATVDGLDVMNGQPGTFDNRGYVLTPFATLEIDGFRQSEDQVASFRFAKVRDSYAAQRGEARNVGVIGVAFFAERGDDWSTGDTRLRDTASPFPREGRFAPPPR
jgi:hypothetical protein